MHSTSLGGLGCCATEANKNTMLWKSTEPRVGRQWLVNGKGSILKTRVSAKYQATPFNSVTYFAGGNV